MSMRAVPECNIRMAAAALVFLPAQTRQLVPPNSQIATPTVNIT